MWTLVAPTGETGTMQDCEESDCSWEELNEIDPAAGDYGDLHICKLLYPDKAGSGW